MLQAMDGLLLCVADCAKTAEFYKKLGFKTGALNKGIAYAKLGEFIIHFVDSKNRSETLFHEELLSKPKGAGVYLYIKVERIDEYYRKLDELGLQLSGGPKDWPWGNREFTVRDPDCYKLVFYQKSEVKK